MPIVTQFIETRDPYLEIEHHFFPNVKVEMNFDLPEGVSYDDFNELGWKFGVEVKQDKDRDEAYAVEMTIETDNKEPKAYTIKLVAVGLFNFTEDYPDQEKRNHMIYVLGQSILYGLCREYLFTLTAHGPHPAVYLPSVTFVPVKQEKTNAPEQNVLEE